MDGYVDDILKKVPQDEDSVIVEPDGAWRTLDGKVNSSGTAQATPAAEGTPVQDRLLGRDSEDTKPSVGSSAKPNGAKRSPPDEIVLLDSPSPPPESTPSASASTSAPSAAASSSSAAGHQVRNGATSTATTSSAAHAPPLPPAASSLRHERIELLSSSASTSARNSPATGAGEVIDLTLDSDDESEPSVPTRPAASNGTHTHTHTHAQPSNASSSSNTHHNNNSTSSPSTSASRGAFTNYSSSSTVGTPHRTGPFAAAMARVEATPDDEQIRRPGKRPRAEAIPTPTDPRLVNGRRPGSLTAEEARRTSMPATWPEAGANGTRSNGSTDSAAGASGGGGGGGGGSAAGGARGTYRDPASARGAGEDDEGDDSWMDNANTSDNDQYLNEDEWWP